MSFQVSMTKHGRVRYQARAGATDDLISALCLALVCLSLSRDEYAKQSERHELRYHRCS